MHTSVAEILLDIDAVKLSPKHHSHGQADKSQYIAITDKYLATSKPTEK